MIEVNNALLAHAEKFRQAFGYLPPLLMVPQSLSNEELCAQIDDCIARGTDDLVQRYLSENDPDILY